MENTSMGDRMKGYESSFKHILPRRTHTLVRVDGRAFHTVTRGLDRPYDLRFMGDMDAVGVALCKEITGSVMAYVQSDEVSVLVTDYQSVETQPWCGGVAAKFLSLSAARAAVTFGKRRADLDEDALFDSRVFTINDPIEVGNYFVWRQRDATRNSVSMTGQAHFSHKSLQGLNGGQVKDKLLAEKGVDWEASPAGFKLGRIVVRDETSSWVVKDAPKFQAIPGSFLAETIPPLPSFV